MLLKSGRTLGWSTRLGARPVRGVLGARRRWLSYEMEDLKRVLEPYFLKAIKSLEPLSKLLSIEFEPKYAQPSIVCCSWLNYAAKELNWQIINQISFHKY